MVIREITDREEWERFWEQHAPQALFQSWLWGEVVKKQSLPLTRFGLYDGSKLVGMFQTVTVRARRGTYLHVRQGPIFLKYTVASWKNSINFLQKTARESHASFFRVSPPIDDSTENRGLLRSLGMHPAAVHEVDAQRCWVLDITPSEETILAGMRKTTRYEIKRAMKEGVVAETSEEPKRLQPFFDLYKLTATRHGFVPHTGIREEFEVFSREHRAILLTGRHDGKITAAAIVLFVGGQAIYHHGASLMSRIPVSYLVQWEAIREAKRRGMKRYNFWGIAPLDAAHHPWHGITVFKTGFGGQETRTMHAHDLPITPWYWMTRGIEWWERARKGY